MKKFSYYIVAVLVVIISAFVLIPKIAERGEADFSPPVTSKEVSVTISALDASYPIAIKEEKNIYEAMIGLASSSPFTFKAKYFPDLGYFVEEINAVRNNGGYYWTLYINDAYSSVGASNYRLRDGDRVEWRFEKK